MAAFLTQYYFRYQSEATRPLSTWPSRQWPLSKMETQCSGRRRLTDSAARKVEAEHPGAVGTPTIMDDRRLRIFWWPANVNPEKEMISWWPGGITPAR
jgi:hypothetical protein